LIITISDATALYLGRRSVAAAADATALAAAQGADVAAIYAGRATTGLPLSLGAVRTAADTYVRDAGLATTLRGFRIESVVTDGRSVRVVVKAVVRLPFVGLISTGAGQVTVRVAARATSPVG
jgi:Flp pilus assembly protein TadG